MKSDGEEYRKLIKQQILIYVNATYFNGHMQKVMRIEYNENDER